MVGSNFHAVVDAELCDGCGSCLGRCRIDAVAVADGLSSVDLKRCIGCGLCVPTCPEGARRLVRKAHEVVPPVTPEDMFETIQAQKSTVAGKLRNRSLKAFLRVMMRLSSGGAGPN